MRLRSKFYNACFQRNGILISLYQFWICNSLIWVFIKSSFVSNVNRTGKSFLVYAQESTIFCIVRRSKSTCRVYKLYRISQTITIRRPAIILLRHRINTCKASGDNFHLSGIIIIPVQTIIHIQFLIIIFIRLFISVSTLCKRHAERIIMICLNYRPVRLSHHTIIAQMVLQIEVVSTILNVTTIHQYTL